MKQYGYVIEMKKTSSSYPGFYSVGTPYARSLQHAFVSDRAEARVNCFTDETVRKVGLFKNGRPKRVVKKERKQNLDRNSNHERTRKTI